MGTDTLADFDAKCHNTLRDLVAWQAFWRNALERDIEIPYDADKSLYNRYVNIAQHGEYDSKTGTTPLDVDATRKEFAKVVKWAKENGWKVEKKYKDDEFTISVTGIHDPILSVEFYSTRQVVCQKVVIGTEIVPEHTKEIVEYQCDKVAFLSVDV